MWLGCWFEQLVCCIHLFVFFLSLKNSFLQARQLFDRSTTASYLLSPLDFFSRQILSHIRSIELSGVCLDSFSIHRETLRLADRFSTKSRSIEELLPSTDSRQHLDRFISRHLVLDRSQQLLNPSKCVFLYMYLRHNPVFIFSLLS